MRKLNVLFVVLSLIIFLSSNCFSQQWSAEQKEVWKTVETYNELASKSDVQGFLSYIDESYCGWSYMLDTPTDKSSAKKSIEYWFPNSKTIYYTITPAKIWVNGDYAFVHYYYIQYYENDEGKKEFEKGRWTDILMKKDGKWIMVGDHGGKTSK
jgi:ketosteroid isomerase-like protein